MNEQVNQNAAEGNELRTEDLQDVLKAVRLLASDPESTKKVQDWEKLLLSSQSGRSWLSIFLSHPEAFYVHETDGIYVVLVARFFTRNIPLDENQIAVVNELVHKANVNALSREQTNIANTQAQTAKDLAKRWWIGPVLGLVGSLFGLVGVCISAHVAWNVGKMNSSHHDDKSSPVPQAIEFTLSQSSPTMSIKTSDGRKVLNIKVNSNGDIVFEKAK